MIRPRLIAVACCAVVLAPLPLAAQDLTRYRDYTLESTVASVMATSGSKDADLKRSFERPALIQELLWRPPYELSGREPADPVLDLRFGFFDGRLFRVVVTYDPRRTEGLTDDDVIETLAASYGPPGPVAVPAEPASSGLSHYLASTVVARWEDSETTMTLSRGVFPTEFRLTLTSRALDARATAAIAEARRLDAVEGPQRDRAERDRLAAGRLAAADEARRVNKPAFRP